MEIHPKEARLRLGLTQEQMAIVCDTSVGTVSKWDQGQREPRGQARQLIKLLLLVNDEYPDIFPEILEKITAQQD